VAEVVIEVTDSPQMTVNGVWCQSPSLQEIDVLIDVLGRYQFDRSIQPENKMRQAMYVVLYGMWSVVFSL
jgi:hypothetical protein